ncbi:MAG: cation:proton antiporter, partial [Thermoplasmata archaeon]
MIPPNVTFLLLAGVAFLGLVLDALFERLRVTSALPLMILGIALVYFHLVPSSTIQGLNALVPFVSALTIAFILFHVGLGIRFESLSRVLGRTMAYTLAVQVTTGVVLSLLAWATFHWDVLICFVFGFALSGPSSVAVPLLVRVARMSESLRTALLFESVVTDLLQLIVPLILIGIVVSGNFSTAHLGGLLALTLLGSTAAGIAAALFWLWLLEQIGPIVREYSWTLTITMVLATYGLADYLGLSAAISIFVFGLVLGNRKLLAFDPLAHHGWGSSAPRQVLGGVRRALRLSALGIDIGHIQQVQKEVSFFASAFFFVYIGLLFQLGGLSATVVLVPLLAAFAILALRAAFSPILTVFLSPRPAARKSEESLLAFNISRGLASAVVATVPLSYGLVIPGFLDSIFLGILFTTVVSTVGIFFFYAPHAPEPLSEEPFDPARATDLSPEVALGSSARPPITRPSPPAP